MPSRSPSLAAGSWLITAEQFPEPLVIGPVSAVAAVSPAVAAAAAAGKRTSRVRRRGRQAPAKAYEEGTALTRRAVKPVTIALIATSGAAAIAATLFPGIHASDGDQAAPTVEPTRTSTEDSDPSTTRLDGKAPTPVTVTETVTVTATADAALKALPPTTTTDARETSKPHEWVSSVAGPLAVVVGAAGVVVTGRASRLRPASPPRRAPRVRPTGRRRPRLQDHNASGTRR
ncbi:hypothetical protein SAMN05421874_10921 [Nonomuraea maritima]|uniref:Uncharacterized protein n=1 Tax=Nonomuraea maritima TaxID=683260 RepID=A0A1G9D820_9ACTN|nr:hypothetical protein SAMN05421874_10921 [Nonomuraea maritima]